MLTFSDKQTAFIKYISKISFFNKFYLNGGTALSAVYFHHRDSEDLDFFSPEQFSDIDLQSHIIGSKKILKWKKWARSSSHGINYYILEWIDGNKLKLDFNYLAFRSLGRKKKVYGVMVDSLLDYTPLGLHTPGVC